MFTLVGAHAVENAVGRVDAPQWLGDIDPTGVEEPGERTRGFPRNLGYLLVSTVLSAGECRTANFQASGRVSRTERSEALDAASGIALANLKSRAGRTSRGRSAFTVPLKPGNRSRTGPGRGKGGVESLNRWRETCRRHRTPITCTRDNSG